MRTLALAVLLLAVAADAQLTPDQQRIVDASVRAEMDTTRVPAISLAIVRNGAVVYAHAYGVAQLAEGNHPARPATNATRFAIGSVSKQFTAAAVLLLAQQGKLSLADPVAKYLPELTDAREITVRDLLAHASGYADYFTQEYIPAETQRPTTVDAILKGWGQRKLEFEPGTRWGYSGTNYVIAARIVEIASGQPFFAFLQKNILAPAGITDAGLADEPSSPLDASGYFRFALGAARPAPKTGRNWLFGMAALTMTAEDLARWDVSIINRSVLQPASYDAMETESRLRDGRPTGYGLGVMLREVTTLRGARLTVLAHPGEISGFRSSNYVVPQVGTALVILTNAEYSDAVQHLARRLQGLLGFAAPVDRNDEGPNEGPNDRNDDRPNERREVPETRRARTILDGLAKGTMDRSELTAEASAVFTPQAIEDLRNSLAALGRLLNVRVNSEEIRGTAQHLAITARYEFGSLDISEYVTQEGKVQQFFVDASPQ